MKKTTLILSTLAIVGGHAFCASAIPAKWPKERYTETVSDSPFVIETPKAPEEPPPAKEEPMFVNSISDVDGKPYVVIKRVSDSSTLRLMLGEKSSDGVTVTNIKMGEKFSSTEVEIDENGRKRWIKFNESSAAPAAKPPAGNRGAAPANSPGGRPGQLPSMTPTITKPGGTPTLQTPPSLRPPTNAPAGNIPRPSINPASRGASSGVDPNAGEQRRRVRTINNR